MVAREGSDLSACVKGHQATAVSDIDHISHVINDHDDGSARARPLRADLYTWILILSFLLCLFNKLNKTPLTLFETCNYCLVGKLREVFILDYKIV